MSSLSGVERRINLRLLSYWEKLRRDRPMPAPEELNPDDLPDLWPSCFIIGFPEPGKKTCHYDHLGQFIVDAYNNGLIRGDSGVMVSPSPQKTIEQFSQVIETCKPLVQEGEFINHNEKIVKYRQCLLPLGRDGQIEAVFGGMSFKIFS